MRLNRWSAPQLDRRACPRAEYRRTAPALLELEGYRCAVRDLAPGGLRIEPAPAGRVWEYGERVTGILHLRIGGLVQIGATIGRIDRAGLALVPDSEAWPDPDSIDAERSVLVRWHHERRSAPRLPLPASPGGTAASTPLRDVSATGLRYALAPLERAPAAGSHVAGELRLDADTVIPVRGQVIRHVGREIAVALDPPGLAPDVLALLRRRYFPEGNDSAV
ncbi:MAG: PilZ domain-containing protein [Gemmatimonadales bacterium]|nr:PilZ domain-containing protein [Gemmatimonadales bacterium]